MGYAVRVEDQYACILECFVEEGQGIKPGADLFEVMGPDGVAKRIKADCWGIIAHVEEPVQAANDAVFHEGEILCHIAKRKTRYNRDGALHPRPAVWIRLAREAGLRP